MVKKSVLLKVVLAGVCVSHVVIGLIGCFPAIPVESLAEYFYKAKVTVTPQLAHVVQMFGAYMLTIGILAMIALRDTVKYKSVIQTISFLLFVRVLQRVLFAGQAHELFSIPAGWYWTQTIFFFIVGVGLIALRPKNQS